MTLPSCNCSIINLVLFGLSACSQKLDFFFFISAALMAGSLLNKNIFNVGETLKLKGNITVNTQKIVIAESK